MAVWRGLDILLVLVEGDFLDAVMGSDLVKTSWR